MGLETGTTIRDLDASNPPGGDPRSQGAGHLRLIKDVLKNIFPGANGDGFDTPITATEAEINQLAGVTGLVKNQAVPIGGIIMWSGGVVPSNWHLCDGTGGTPDLSDKFVMAAGSTYPAGSSGGSADSIVVSHSHTVVDHTHAITDPGHTHSVLVHNQTTENDSTSGGDLKPKEIDATLTTASANTGITINNATGVATNSSGVSGTGANIPPYYSLAFIMRIS